MLGKGFLGAVALRWSKGVVVRRTRLLCLSFRCCVTVPSACFLWFRVCAKLGRKDRLDGTVMAELFLVQYNCAHQPTSERSTASSCFTSWLYIISCRAACTVALPSRTRRGKKGAIGMSQCSWALSYFRACRQHCTPVDTPCQPHVPVLTLYVPMPCT